MRRVHFLCFILSASHIAANVSMFPQRINLVIELLSIQRPYLYITMGALRNNFLIILRAEKYIKYFFKQIQDGKG